MTVSNAMLTYIASRDHTLMLRVNRWPAPRWIRVWMLCATRGGDGWLWPVPDRDTLVSGAYGSASGLKPADFELIAARSTPQPYATFTTPLRLSGAAPAGLRRAAIFCAEGGMSLALLRELIAQHDPRADAFADPSWELHELPTGHWAMFSLPGPLAGLLDQIAAAPSG